MQEGERTNERSEGLPLANGAFGIVLATPTYATVFSAARRLL